MSCSEKGGIQSRIRNKEVIFAIYTIPEVSYGVTETGKQSVKTMEKCFTFGFMHFFNEN